MKTPIGNLSNRWSARAATAWGSRRSDEPRAQSPEPSAESREPPYDAETFRDRAHLRRPGRSRRTGTADDADLRDGHLCVRQRTGACRVQRGAVLEVPVFPIRESHD